MTTTVPLSETDPIPANKMLKFTREFAGSGPVEIQLSEDRLISFPEGILAFQDCTVFGLTRFPLAEESPILFLQCVNDPKIGFMVADPDILGLPLAAEDREKALEETKMSPSDTQFLCMLSTHPFGDGMALTANLKAPLLIDSVKREGRQHILLNPDYTTQHKL